MSVKIFPDIHSDYGEGMMKSEDLIFEKNMDSLAYLNLERNIQDYRVDEHKSLEDAGFIENLFSLFLERICTDELVPLGVLLKNVERNIIIRVLSMVNGNQKEAAKILRIKYTTLNEKIKKYKIRLRKSVY